MSVTISSTVIPDWNRTEIVGVELRVWCDESFVDAAGILHLGGGFNANVVRRIACTVDTTAKTITVPSFSLPSTTDGLDNQLRRYYATFVQIRGGVAVELQDFSNLSNGFQLGPTPTSTTWPDIIDFNTFFVQNYDNSAWPKDVSDRRYLAASTILNTVDRTTDQAVAGNKSFTGVTRFGAYDNINDGGWSNTGGTSLMAHGADSSSASPRSSANPSMTFQTWVSGGTVGIGQFGYLFGVNRVAGPGDTYNMGVLLRYAPSMSGFAVTEYFQECLKSHIVMSPTNIPGGASAIGFAGHDMGERTVAFVRAVGRQIEAVNNSSVDADNDGQSIDSTLALNVAGGGAKHNSVGIQFEAGQAQSFGVGIYFKRNSVHRYMMDMTAAQYDFRGTVAVSIGSPTVTGTSTHFIKEIVAGDFVSLNGVDWYEVLSQPVSDTSLTLKTNWADDGGGTSGRTLTKITQPMRLLRPSYLVATDQTTSWKLIGLGQTNKVEIDRDGTGIYCGTALTQITNAAGQLLSTGLSSYSACAYNSANISIPDSVETVITLNSERWDSAAIHSTSVNTSRMTAPVAGVYLITVNLEFDANVNGERYISIRINGGTSIAAPEIKATGGGLNTGFASSRQYSLGAGDYIEVYAFQNSGGALNVVASGNRSPEVQMTRIGSVT